MKNTNRITSPIITFVHFTILIPEKEFNILKIRIFLSDVLGMKIRFITVYFTNSTNQDDYVKNELLTYFHSFCFQYSLTNQYNANINLSNCSEHDIS